jgi:hypothetical protein
MVKAFEGNMTETKTMLPVIEAFMTAHQLPDDLRQALEAITRVS